jgi:hypothetical protein
MAPRRPSVLWKPRAYSSCAIRSMGMLLSTMRRRTTSHEGRSHTVHVINAPVWIMSLVLARCPTRYTKEPYQNVIWALCKHIGR